MPMRSGTFVHEFAKASPNAPAPLPWPSSGRPEARGEDRANAPPAILCAVSANRSPWTRPARAPAPCIH